MTGPVGGRSGRARCGSAIPSRAGEVGAVGPPCAPWWPVDDRPAPGLIGRRTGPATRPPGRGRRGRRARSARGHLLRAASQASCGGPCGRPRGASRARLGDRVRWTEAGAGATAHGAADVPGRAAVPDTSGVPARGDRHGSDPVAPAPPASVTASGGSRSGRRPPAPPRRRPPRTQPPVPPAGSARARSPDPGRRAPARP